MGALKAVNNIDVSGSDSAYRRLQRIQILARSNDKAVLWIIVSDNIILDIAHGQHDRWKYAAQL